MRYCNCSLSRHNHSVSQTSHMWPRYHTEVTESWFMAVNVWTGLAHQLWPFLESIQTQNKSVAFLSERQTHFLIKGSAWTVRRVQERAQCLSPYTPTPAAPHLCRYDRSLCRGAKVKPRSDCCDFVDHSKDATLGARAHTEPDYNLCIGNTVCAVPTCAKSTLDGTE